MKNNEFLDQIRVHLKEAARITHQTPESVYLGMALDAKKKEYLHFIDGDSNHLAMLLTDLMVKDERFADTVLTALLNYQRYQLEKKIKGDE